MRSWKRWQDWVALVAGLYALLAPIWTATTTATTWTMVVLGVVLAATALWSLAAPGAVASEWIHAGLGVLFIIAPFALSFTDMTMIAITAWVVGVVALAMGLLALPASNRLHQRAVPQH